MSANIQSWKKACLRTYKAVMQRTRTPPISSNNKIQMRCTGSPWIKIPHQSKKKKDKMKHQSSGEKRYFCMIRHRHVMTINPAPPPNMTLRSRFSTTVPPNQRKVRRYLLKYPDCYGVRATIHTKQKNTGRVKSIAIFKKVLLCDSRAMASSKKLRGTKSWMGIRGFIKMLLLPELYGGLGWAGYKRCFISRRTLFKYNVSKKQKKGNDKNRQSCLWILYKLNKSKPVYF